MDIITELKQRGVINNITNEEKAQKFLSNKDFSLYIGFDPSFRSLHLGNYLMLVTLKRFIQHGYKPIALVGGATGQIGDPSGKKAERKILQKDLIKENVEAIKKQFHDVLGDNVEVVNNADFYEGMSIFDFFREIGKNINVNYLLEKEIISKRLETGISYAEFSYNLIQGYDFQYLYQHKNVVLQMGGSDQWGNITTGIEMIRKAVGDNNNAFGITFNLLTKSDGTKFGKSEGGAFYLDKTITSPYTMYQFLLNQSDADVEKLLKYLTFYSIEEINQIIAEHNQNPSLRIGQKKLADAIVKDIHGEDELNKCHQISQMFFTNSLDQLSAQDLKMALSCVNNFDVIGSDSISILDALVGLKVVDSKSKARQLITGKSIYVNNKLVEDINMNVTKSMAIDNEFVYLRKGKKNYFIINFK